MKPKNTDVKTTVSLVLGSGGARGIAHIGVIRWLEDNNFEIKSISGCSIGALVGGVYAAGKLEQLAEWMLAMEKSDIASLLDFSWGSGGLFKGDKIINTLVSLLEDIQIENLPIPFTAVATDITTEKEVWINTGSLFDAIRASASLPLLFTPVKRGGSILVDGGVLNPVPIAPTFNDDSDVIIAVNLGGAIQLNDTAPPSVLPKTTRTGKFKDEIEKFLTSLGTSSKKSDKKSLGMYQVADKAFDTMQGSIARLKMASYPPDLEIEIARNACGTLEFDRAEEMIKLGYETAQLTYDFNNKAG